VPQSPRPQTIADRLAAETGRIAKEAPFKVALGYPSAYGVAMSSLGYQRIYRAIQEADGMCCERFFVPDSVSGAASRRPAVTYESRHAAADFAVVAVSVAYELEIAGLVTLLESSGIAALSKDRTDRDPFVVLGGPLTFSNPLPLVPFADAIVMGEGETTVVRVLSAIERASGRQNAVRNVAALPHVLVPACHGEAAAPLGRADDELLPAWGPIRTVHAELSGMFLVEAERGCSRGCTYCVMRRGPGSGMRVVPMERILSVVPDGAGRVGLVGAAVSDHPEIEAVVRALAERGTEVGLSSLRPDRLTDGLVSALRAAGHKTLTTAMDGASERLRHKLERHAHEEHLVRAAELARAHRMKRLKLYLMVGLPDETDADIDECAALVGGLSRTIPVSLGIAPFCAKKNTPLDGAPFAGTRTIGARIAHLRRRLAGRAEVRSVSPRWSFVEHVLAQGGSAEGRLVYDAVHRGGRFSDYRAAFEALGWNAC
jgi:radical SAM superfamily enzyme YgiQ (UPF0313 family)